MQKYQYGGYHNEHNIYGYFRIGHDDHMDYGLHRAFKVSKKEGRKRKQPQKTICPHACGNGMYDCYRYLIHSENPVLK